MQITEIQLNISRLQSKQ